MICPTRFLISLERRLSRVRRPTHKTLTKQCTVCYGIHFRVVNHNKNKIPLYDIKCVKSTMVSSRHRKCDQTIYLVITNNSNIITLQINICKEQTFQQQICTKNCSAVQNLHSSTANMSAAKFFVHLIPRQAFDVQSTQQF